MNKKVYVIAIALLSLVFASCGDDEDKIDEEWKTMNEAAFTKIYNDKSYNQLASPSGNGNVAWKEVDVLENNTIDTRISPEGKPYYTDTVSVLYEGWYFNKEGKKIVFDKTYNAQPVKFAVNGVIEGWTTLLQDMKVGEEREVWIPWALAYGAYGNNSIPGYTTLVFNVKVKDIISMRGRD